jgi:hypothetical protein
MATASSHEQEVEVRVPNIGLSKQQLESLKTSFQNHLVSTMGEKSAAATRIIIVRIRIIIADQEI